MYLFTQPEVNFLHSSRNFLSTFHLPVAVKQLHERAMCLEER